jgi:hypothetical protein
MVLLIGPMVMVGLATLAILFATGELGGRTLSGEVRIVESQTARFDRQVHAGMVDALPEPGNVDARLCLKLAAARDAAPGHSIVLYDGGGSVIGQGTLGPPGQSIDESRPAHAGDVVCRLEFQIGDVRRTDVVRIELGSRTRATYDAEALDQRGWYVELELIS